ncbi:2'-5' RNA ligase family protein [Halorubrum sp. Atlit-8R]|uniref:2'-5' RNA ligase family protein n=1 Tax=unclassified Halorubrum TaxID=2642239 RepID=UPI000EF231EB|nr:MULTISPECIES: 2'-5' RNA ligase family protein [unclassified Halorubrum]RLM68214.1 2'-5' RNA ligase family protein [Halorubrum sp. Atlit-9R]RLM81445.1 2'-5' RNA ligase family protein [Halorubrum sp. Atlit-8R]
MFSLNVPLPPGVDRLAADLHPKLKGFDTVRERRTLVCKRFGVADVRDGERDASEGGGRERSRETPPREEALDRLRERLRRPLAGVDPFEVAVTGIDVFDAPRSGSRPVVYLTVESDGLDRLHRRLCAAFGPVEGIEGDDYVPHVTLARGGNPEPGAVADLVDAAFDPIRWRVHALDVWDPEFREVAASVEL